MSRVPLAEPTDLPASLQALHDGAAPDDWSTQHVARAFAAAPELLDDYLAFYYPWHASTAEGSRLTPRLKELVRLRIATLNGCRTCAAARLAPDTVPEDQAVRVDGFAGDGAYSPAEQAAIAFAGRLATEHHDLDDADVAALREHFDDGQILELMMMAGQFIGFGRVLAVLQLETVTCSVPAPG
jgi:alkylhydroperoxidase family enzyme